MPARRRLVLVANPAASQFTGGMHREVLARLRAEFEVDAQWPETAEAVTRVAADSAEAGIDVVVAMGGDGVVNRVVNGIALTQTALGIIPVGTTNVLAAILGVDPDPIKATAQIVAQPPVQSIDLARITLDGALPIYATFAAGVGFDAEVVHHAERTPHKKLFMGGVHYAKTAATVLWSEFRHRLPTLRVTVGDDNYDAVVALVEIHWPYTYFGRVPLSLAKEAPTNGFHLAGVDRLPMRRIPAIGIAAARGASWSDIKGGFQALNQQEVLIEADPPALVQADGDVLGSANRIEIHSVPNGVLVVV